MLSKTLENGFNDQIQKEFYSSYLYLAMAAHFESANLPGFASWMKKQADEERSHGMRLWEHVYDRGGKVELKAIEQPPAAFGTPLEVLQQVLAHEQKVTSSINALYASAFSEGDVAALACLQWFVTEQVEEEKTASELIEQLRMAGDHGFGALFMDKHVLGARK
ncbi:MAG: ferritin [Polyangiaceae bacterium]|nr:ferritin [Polyangiaceae bacterium]